MNSCIYFKELDKMTYNQLKQQKGNLKFFNTKFLKHIFKRQHNICHSLDFITIFFFFLTFILLKFRGNNKERDIFYLLVPSPDDCSSHVGPRWEPGPSPMSPTWVEGAQCLSCFSSVISRKLDKKWSNWDINCIQMGCRYHKQ